MTPVRRAAAALAALVLLLAAGPAVADPQTASLNLHQWGSVTLFHGLPSDHVRAIAQDVEGALWFGTDGGLARFDGRRTQTIGTAAVRALARDAGGTVWAGGEGGAWRVVNGTLVAVPGTEGKTITAIAAFGDREVVLTTTDGEILDCVTTDGATATAAASPVTSAALSAGGGPLELTSVVALGDRVAVGTLGRGVLFVEPYRSVDEVVSRPRSFYVRALAAGADGRLLVGAAAKNDDGGIFDAADITRPRRLGASAGTVNAIAVDAAGDVWAGTDDRGAIRYRAGAEVERLTFEGSAGGLRSNRVYAVFVDREGVVWFGTDRGACRYDPGSPRVEVFGEDPDPNFVRAVLRDRAGRTWFGTNRGLFAREGDGPWRAIVGAERRVVYALAEAPDGTVLVGTGGGLLAVGRDGEATPLVADLGDGSGGVRGFRIANGRTVVATYGRGLARLDGDRLDYFWPPASADPSWRDVVSLSPDGPDRAVVGTASAGAFDLDGASVSRGDALAPFAADAVWATARDAEGVLWVATGRGLFAADDPSAPALNGVDARCVLAADGAVWCGTTAGGAVTVRRDATGGTVVSRLDTEHGLPSNGVFALAAVGDALLLATSKGLVTYRPDAVAPGLRVARAFGARAYETAEVERGLSLEYPQNGLAVEVAATSSRTFPEQFQYAFAVFDERGRRVASRCSHDAQLVLDNLSPGAYRVEARAYSTDLVVSDPVVVAFRVERAPFPRGVAALSFLLAAALGVLWWGARQNRRLTTVNAELRETRSQLARETETERRRIARDLHDQTLADLRRLLLVADEEHAGGPLRSEIEAISTEIRRICEDLSPSVLANVGLTAALEWALADAVAHLPEGRKFEYAFECADEVEDGLRADAAEWIQVYRIVQEAVANVCRHADASRVVLSARLDGEGTLVVELDDDGRGFDARGGRVDGRGLGNIRSRASMIGASVEWSRRDGGGTRFRLEIPRNPQR